MKNLFKCEKCGKVSENYDEIVNCENMHYVFSNLCDYDTDINETLNSMTEYKEGQEEPSVIHVWFRRSYWDGETWKEEKRCWKYKLISSYEMPLKITNE